LLNIITRIGIAQKKSLVLKPRKDADDTIYKFMDEQGRLWGARQEIIDRASRVITEFVEVSREIGLVKSEIQSTVSYDEFNLDITLQYQGRPMDFSGTIPTADEVLADRSALYRLSAGIIQRSVDRMACVEKNGVVTLQLHFDH